MGSTDCHKDDLSIAYFRILLQFRISFSGFLVSPALAGSHKGRRQRSSTNYEIAELPWHPCSSLESRRSITNHILALAH